MPSTPIGSLFTAELLAKRLPPPGGWRPFPPVSDRAAWDAVHAPTRELLLATADAALARPWPLLTAGGYLRFSVDGDRAGYEEPYFARRARLAAAVLDAGLRGPTAERIAVVADGVWLLCEETSWCLPAHSPTPLPDPERPYVDLFAAETAALLAWTDLLAGDLVERQVRSRLHDEVRKRVLDPYRTRDDWHWFGLTGANLNNWTTWIHANLLTASLLLDGGHDEIVTTARRTVGALDRYLAAVPADGGCDEGAGYWWRAGGSLFECLHTLGSACGTDPGVFAIPQVRAIAAYPMLVHIAGDWQVNFADGPARASGGLPRLLHAFGQHVGDAEVARHARALRGDDTALVPAKPPPDGSLGRLLGALFDAEWAAEPSRRFPMPGQAWLPDTGVLVARERPGTPGGLFLAAKAGHNAESHNHNDVGSFVVALDGRPLLIDVGVGVYTRQTFGPDRYQIWSMQSSWHNLPEVDGVAQRPGRSFTAGDVRATLSDGRAELAMDLAPAYPPEAGIASWRRAVRLDRGPGVVSIDDTWELTRDPGRVVLHLVTATEPREAADGHLVVPGEGRDLVVRYPRETLTAGVERRLVNDRRLAATWGRAVWRVTLTATAPARHGSAHVRINASHTEAGRLWAHDTQDDRGRDERCDVAAGSRDGTRTPAVITGHATSISLCHLTHLSHLIRLTYLTKPPARPTARSPPMAPRSPDDPRPTPASRRSLLARTATGLLAGAGAMAAGGVLTRPQAAEAATATSPDWLDITASPYSADPTGKSDSTAGIQAALKQVAANGGGVIYVPAGDYKITSGLTYDSSTPLMITGDGPQASNIRLAAASTGIQYLTITQTGDFVGGDFGRQGTVIIENLAFYNDEQAASYSDTHVVVVMNHVNFGQVRNVCIYEGAGPQWINQGIILNECNQVDVDNANIFTAVNGIVVSGYSQVNNISNTSIWMRTTGQPNAAAVLYLGQVLTANMESVICHDGDRGIYFTQDSAGNVPHLLFAYNIQPNNHTVAAMEIDSGAQVYLTECFFSGQTGIVDLPVPGVLFGPEYQGSATVVSSQFNGIAGHTISVQGGQGFFITGCEIGGNKKYKYAADSYDEINIGASVAEVTIDTCHFDVDTLAGPGTSNQPRSAVNVAAGATGVTVSNCKGAGTAYATAGIIDSGNAVMRNGNIGLGLADQTTGGGSTVTGTSSAGLSASIPVPAYDMTVGTVYRLTAFGHGTHAGGPPAGLRLEMTVGGASLGTFTPARQPGPGGAFSWTYTCYLAVTATGSAGKLTGSETFTWAGATASHGNDSFPVDTTKANAVVLTASWTPGRGSPSITCDRTMLERVQNYPAS